MRVWFALILVPYFHKLQTEISAILEANSIEYNRFTLRYASEENRVYSHANSHRYSSGRNCS